jgi:hypothetical protein
MRWLRRYKRGRVLPPVPAALIVDVAQGKHTYGQHLGITAALAKYVQATKSVDKDNDNDKDSDKGNDNDNLAPIAVSDANVEAAFVECLAVVMKEMGVDDYMRYDAQSVAAYFHAIADGVRKWAQWTEKMIPASKHSSEELMAGIRTLNEKIGVFGTIKNIAKEYHIHFDDVLKLQYSIVMQILYTDRLEAEYHKKYMDIISSKHKHVPRK